MSAVHKLHTETQAARIMKDALLRRFPNLSDDEQTLSDTLDGETDLSSAIELVIEEIAELETLIVGAKARADELRLRAGRMEDKAEKLRDAVLEAMQDAGFKKLTFAGATVSVRVIPQRALIADDKAAVEAGFGTSETKTVYSIDRPAITQELKAGASFTFATLSNGGVTLAIKKG